MPEINLPTKATQDAIKQKTDLIGAPNPTTAGTDTVMNYLKKLEASASQSTNGYVPKMVGSIGLDERSWVIPYNNRYVIQNRIDGNYDYLGLMDKTATGIVSYTMSRPYSAYVSKWSLNISKGWAYHATASGITAVNIMTNTLKSITMDGVTVQNTLIAEMDDGNVLIATMGNTKWYVYSPDLSTLISTITVSFMPGMNGAAMAYDKKSNMLFLAQSTNIQTITYKSYKISDGTATIFHNETLNWNAGSNATTTTVIIGITDNYVMLYGYGAPQYIIIDKVDASKKYGGAPFAPTNSGMFGGSSGGGKTLGGLDMRWTTVSAFAFYHLGADKFMILRYERPPADSLGQTPKQTGVIARIVGGTIVPISKIFDTAIPPLNYNSSGASTVPNELMTNIPMQNGRIVIRGCEYDISDIMEV